MNNKKITIMFILVAVFILLGIVGFTFAFFTSSTDFENEFQTGLFQTEATETFTSPQNWLPGDTTPKELTIKNTGNIDVVARVCMTEKWESDNGDTLPNEVNGERVAFLNLANTSDWTQRGNCFYYNDTLEPDDETSSFIESVTFNPNIESDITCTTNGNTKTCSSTGDGYDNATYTLTFTVETAQVEYANDLWLFNSTRYMLSPLFGNEGVDEIISNSYSTPEELMLQTNKDLFIRYDFEGGKIIDQYIVFRITEEMAQEFSGLTVGTYMLRYGNGSQYYETNSNILLTAYGDSYCTISSDNTECVAGDLNGTEYISGVADMSGNVSARIEDYYYTFLGNIHIVGGGSSPK